MKENTPLEKSKDQYSEIIKKIESNSSVGIDAQYTHAVIIEYLQRIEERLDRIEQNQNNKS